MIFVIHEVKDLVQVHVTAAGSPGLIPLFFFFFSPQSREPRSAGNKSQHRSEYQIFLGGLPTHLSKEEVKFCLNRHVRVRKTICAGNSPPFIPDWLNESPLYYTRYATLNSSRSAVTRTWTWKPRKRPEICWSYATWKLAKKLYAEIGEKIFRKKMWKNSVEKKP